MVWCSFSSLDDKFVRGAWVEVGCSNEHHIEDIIGAVGHATMRVGYRESSKDVQVEDDSRVHQEGILYLQGLRVYGESVGVAKFTAFCESTRSYAANMREMVGG